MWFWLLMPFFLPCLSKERGENSVFHLYLFASEPLNKHLTSSSEPALGKLPLCHNPRSVLSRDFIQIECWRPVSHPTPPYPWQLKILQMTLNIYLLRYQRPLSWTSKACLLVGFVILPSS